MRKIAASRAALAIGLSLLAAGCGPVSAAFHNPGDLPALPHEPSVHYGTNARDYAEAVAKLLPTAVARIEAAQGRPFGNPFVVAAYLDDEAYVASNGSGSAKPSAVTFFDRVTLSPRLWREEPEYLEADLTHELSHEHLFSHLAGPAYYRVPVWFTEGLAVMVSDGGGAQRVSTEDAEREIAAGRFIATPDEANFFGNISLKPPSRVGSEEPRLRMHLAYRQAGLFVAFLSTRDPAAFKVFMNRLLDGERFKAAFEAGYGQSVGAWRSRFLAQIAAQATTTE